MWVLLMSAGRSSHARTMPSTSGGPTMTRQTTLLERAADRTTDAVETAVELTQGFIENTAKPFVENTAKPFVENTAKPVLTAPAAKTVPLVAAGAGIAADRATQAKEYAEAKSRELTGQPKKKR